MTGRRFRPALVALLLVLAAGCVSPEEAGQRQPEAVDDGVQLTGRYDGAQLAITDGLPDVVFTDCDPGDGQDRDVCWVARTIDGATVAFVIENPDVLVPGEVLTVRNDSCRDCDDVTDKIVIDIRKNGEQRRATSGTVTVIDVGERIAARVKVSFPGGDTLTGSFNVRELRPGEE